MERKSEPILSRLARTDSFTLNLFSVNGNPTKFLSMRKNIITSEALKTLDNVCFFNLQSRINIHMFS